jgi:thioredoxin-like negative regulator of GroEL
LANFQQLTQFDFHHYIEEQTGICLVVFSNRHCASCRYLEQLLDKYVAERADIQICLIDAQQEPGLVQEFEVFHLPGVFMFVDGQFHQPLHFEARLDKLEQSIHNALLQQPQDAP